ncbi:YdcF family protein [Sphingomonas piscis]|uniref:YdcF family protein n=1 Tax=Sphingomonas piscis TaxID=2714943 RepID=A0A6G7YPQ6_9SPHN|nr:YdcF family protein [Sphingomonas piscis]QIK78721.1 YdcF family protein [Sphingomonas piscis]
MIARILSVLLLAYALGFAIFATTLGQPAAADAPATEAAVVLTGGAGRLEQGFRVMREQKARRMLVSGTDPLVTKADLARRNRGQGAILRCCVDLGTEAKDTRSNAEETGRWLKQQKLRSVRLITSDWHMRRARYEFRRVLGSDTLVVPDAVRTEPRFLTLFGEYNKYVLRRLAVWVDV